MKNSSRFDAKIARNFTRSRSGLFASSASSSTRALNSSQLNSRLIKCSGRKVAGSETIVNFTTPRRGPTGGNLADFADATSDETRYDAEARLVPDGREDW